MALIIEQSNKAYEHRDKAQLEIAAIEQANRKEDDAYQQQMNELTDELERINEQLLISSRRNQQPIFIDPSEEERKAAEREEVARTNEIARVEEEQAQQRKERMQTFEEAFRKISTATDISDVDEFVRLFIENEEHNFSLFRYLNEQAAEIERLQSEIQALQEEGARYEAEEGDDSKERDEIVQIESRIRSTEEQTTAYETKCVSYQKLLDEVKDEIKASAEELFYFKFQLTSQTYIDFTLPLTAFINQTGLRNRSRRRRNINNNRQRSSLSGSN